MPARTTPPVEDIQEDAQARAEGLSTGVTFVRSVEYVLKSIYSQPNQRFLDDFRPYYKIINPDEGLSYPNDGRCVITREPISVDNLLVPEYNLIEEEKIKLEPIYASSVGVASSIEIGARESQKIEELYGHFEPELQVSLEQTPIRADIGIQNSVVGEQISYNSLSSLGAISQEGFTISATTGSVTGLITEQTETITDVGGLSGAGRDRTIIGGGVGGADVTTRGY